MKRETLSPGKRLEVNVNLQLFSCRTPSASLCTHENNRLPVPYPFREPVPPVSRFRNQRIALTSHQLCQSTFRTLRFGWVVSRPSSSRCPVSFSEIRCRDRVGNTAVAAGD